jgi:hypothetical protein
MHNVVMMICDTIILDSLTYQYVFFLVKVKGRTEDQFLYKKIPSYRYTIEPPVPMPVYWYVFFLFNTFIHFKKIIYNCRP